MAIQDSLKVITGKSDETMAIKDVRVLTLLSVGLTAFGTSYLTRKRVAEGKAPIVGFF